MSIVDKLMNLEKLLQNVARAAEDLAEILSKVRVIPELVTTLSKLENQMASVLDQVNQLIQGDADLKAAIAAEREEVKSAFLTLQQKQDATTAELTAVKQQLADLGSPEIATKLEQAIADQQDNLNAAKSIYEAPADTTPAPAPTPTPAPPADVTPAPAPPVAQ